MLVDYRSLTEFCKAFEQYRNMANYLAMAGSAKHTKNGSLHARSTHKRQPNCAPSHPSSSSCSSLPPLCDKSSASAVDIVILILVLGACGFLFTPYFKYVCTEVVEILPLTLILLGEVVYQAPIAYISGSLLVFVLVIGGCELYQYKARKCDNPKCRGLRKAAEFDIQIESEREVKSLSSSTLQSLPSPSVWSFSHEVPWKGSVELGRGHKELEAELKRMAPPNGRAVLVFRSPCGCLATRMEVWGTKKPRKSKK